MDDEQDAADGERRIPDGRPSTGEAAGESASSAEAESAAEAGPADGLGPAPEAGPAYGSVRYTRRRVLILGAAFVAGVAAVIAGVKAFGGQAVDKVGGAIADQFGPFPVRSVDPVPDVPPEKWVVKVDGLVDTPLTLDRAAWSSLQRMNETADFHCVEGWGVDDVRWGGVAPSVLLEQAGVKPEAKYAIVHAYGGVYLSTLPLDLIKHDKTMLADSLNDGPLPPKHGGPLRLVVPVQLGYKNVKWVERIELSDQIRTGYWESNGYPEDAPVLGS